MGNYEESKDQRRSRKSEYTPSFSRSPNCQTLFKVLTALHNFHVYNLGSRPLLFASFPAYVRPNLPALIQPGTSNTWVSRSHPQSALDRGPNCEQKALKRFHGRVLIPRSNLFASPFDCISRLIKARKRSLLQPCL